MISLGVFSLFPNILPFSLSLSLSLLHAFVSLVAYSSYFICSSVSRRSSVLTSRHFSYIDDSPSPRRRRSRNHIRCLGRPRPPKLRPLLHVYAIWRRDRTPLSLRNTAGWTSIIDACAIAALSNRMAVASLAGKYPRVTGETRYTFCLVEVSVRTTAPNPTMTRKAAPYTSNGGTAHAAVVWVDVFGGSLIADQRNYTRDMPLFDGVRRSVVISRKQSPRNL